MNVMNNEGSAPNICTYNAVIDGLCKKGRVHEAFKLLKKGFRRGLQADKSYVYHPHIQALQASGQVQSKSWCFSIRWSKLDLMYIDIVN